MRALIISLNFNPGHVSHLVASYKQCQEIGYEPWLYVNPEFRKFLSGGLNVVDTSEPLPGCDIAIFLFPSLNNLVLIHKLKRSNTKVVYIFHEPLAPLKHYRRAGFSYRYLAKLWVIDHVSALTVKWSDAILLPSRKAEEYYKNNPLYRNSNAFYLPLMYDDELKGDLSRERKYISYIGTVAPDHSFNEFLSFVETALSKGWLEDKHFLIATKSEFKVPESLKSSDRVTIQKGRPLTDEEINEAYSKSAVIWNAYIRTTQSGVLAKSYMFGTPAIVLKQNLNEFMIDGNTVVAIESNTDCQQIKRAIDMILANQAEYCENCRRMFLNTFFYRNYNAKLKSIIE